ncbi:MAG: TIGR01212 family radical SAM protein [Candidatus Fermentibacteraceae bacterium]|nr:TIGR01212 family radical SAM protein [Candidatus Fermentibacteraceae bacterium]
MQRLRLRKLSGFLTDTFGRKVHKVGLVGGFSCPNRDGTLGRNGCSFCNPAASRPAGRREGMSVHRQLEEGCRYIAGRYGVSAFLPYFQDYTTTYGDPSELKELLSSVLRHPGVVGVSLCTRPDCLPDSVLDVLQELSGRTFIWVELGIQTLDDDLLRDMNRCHTAEQSLAALQRLHRRGIMSAAHMILGYPGQTMETVLEDAMLLSASGTAGIKLQNFHVVRDTPMESRFRRGEFIPQGMEEYADMAIGFLELTDPGAVVLRLSGQAPADMTVAPSWSLEKSLIIRTIEAGMEERDTWQGKRLGFPVEALEEIPPAAGHVGEAETIAVTPPPE